MNHYFSIFIFAIALVLFASKHLQAQQTNSSASSSSTSSNALSEKTASQLYEEAKIYVEKKFEEFSKNNIPYSKKLEEQTYREQRELAVRNAEKLIARGKLKGDDLFYLGMLYRFADNEEKSFAALKSFLAERGASPNENAQAARLIVLEISVSKNDFEAAEKILSEFKQNTPVRQDQLFRMEAAITAAYSKAGKSAQAAKHARDAVEAAKAIEPKTDEERDARNEAITTSIMFLAVINEDMKKEAEAVKVLDEARLLGLTLPSASLYENATRMLYEIKGFLSYIKPVERNDNEAAPELIIKEWLDKKPIKLSDLRGKVVLVDFWATWCGPCIKNFPKLRQLRAKYKNKGFEIIGITRLYGEIGDKEVSEEKEIAFLREFKRRFQLSYPIAVHDTSENHSKYGVESIPSVFLLDKMGRVRYINVGSSRQVDKEIEEMIIKLLQE
jgi:thiol-disulfide isomerase/thioredoxin